MVFCVVGYLFRGVGDGEFNKVLYFSEMIVPWVCGCYLVLVHGLGV